MNVILFSQREGRARQFNLAHPLTVSIVAVFALTVLGSAFAIGMQLGQHTGRPMSSGETANWANALKDQKAQITDLRSQLQERADAMAMRLGQIDAQVIRL